MPKIVLTLIPAHTMPSLFPAIMVAATGRNATQIMLELSIPPVYKPVPSRER